MRIHHALKLMLAVLLLTSMVACSLGVLHWKEEIRLSDGRIILVDRTEKGGGRHEPGQRPSPQLRTIRFADPDDPKKIYENFVKGYSNYILLDFEKGVPWLIVRIGPYALHTNCPTGSYEILTWVNQSWQRVPYKSLPAKFQNVNMPKEYKPNMDDPRKQNAILHSDQIVNLIERLPQAGASESSYRLVQVDVHKRPIDCMLRLQQRNQ